MKTKTDSGNKNASIKKIVIGVDFDNTILSYDELFYKLALEKKLIPPTVGRNKSDVRNYLRSVNNEDAWTELQGIGYTTRILEAEAFPGALEFFQRCKEMGVKALIISHKTKYPFIGEKHDLHEWARKWLDKHGFYEKTGLSPNDVFFELTKEEKLKRIGKEHCDYFIDDLPEFLEEKAFSLGVKKVLFDPNKKYTDSERYMRFSSWAELSAGVLDEKKPVVPDYFSSPEFTADVKKLLKKAGLDTKFSIEAMQGGRNNKAFMVSTADGGTFFLKAYFHHPKDPRDRLGAEYGFTSYAWAHSIKKTPKPYAFDDANKLGLYEFVEGRKLSESEITIARVREAIDFFVKLNCHKDSPDAKKLGIASEACFSIKEHLETVRRRVERLKTIDVNFSHGKEALAFVEKELLPAWISVEKKIKESLKERKIKEDRSIGLYERCLSPSDFGYHNALLEDDAEGQEGRLRFLDFEYAGWDDPAKMLCDFFCQPQLPAPPEMFEEFAMAVYIGKDKKRSELKEGEEKIMTAKALLPAYRIKWCCIMLNEFLSTDSERRQFASSSHEGLADARKKQLEKTREYLKGLSLF